MSHPKYKDLVIPVIKEGFLENLPIEKYLMDACLYVKTEYGSTTGICGEGGCVPCLFSAANRGTCIDYLIEKGILDSGIKLQAALEGGVSWAE